VECATFCESAFCRSCPALGSRPAPWPGRSRIAFSKVPVLSGPCRAGFGGVVSFVFLSFFRDPFFAAPSKIYPWCMLNVLFAILRYFEEPFFLGLLISEKSPWCMLNVQFRVANRCFSRRVFRYPSRFYVRVYAAEMHARRSRGIRTST